MELSSDHYKGMLRRSQWCKGSRMDKTLLQRIKHHSIILKHNSMGVEYQVLSISDLIEIQNTSTGEIEHYSHNELLENFNYYFDASYNMWESSKICS